MIIYFDPYSLNMIKTLRIVYEAVTIADDCLTFLNDTDEICSAINIT